MRNINTIEWLSSLRGFAAVLVFVSHLNISGFNEIQFIIGRIGVVLFFLITGYLTHNTISKRNLKQYVINRFFRMYPIFWLLLLIAYFIDDNISVKLLFYNFTMFAEFFQEKLIIGASWMMPIQILFFIGIVLLKFFNKVNSIIIIEKYFYFLCLFSILCAFIRFYSNKAFPTALFLLILIGLLGLIEYRERKLIPRFFLIFELCLFISSILSYPNWVSYIIAYNCGIVLFYLFLFYKFNIKILHDIGVVGFSFFLGAEIPYTLIGRVCPVEVSGYASVLDCVIKFILALVFSYIMTEFCERPVLKIGKRIERHYSVIRK